MRRLNTTILTLFALGFVSSAAASACWTTSSPELDVAAANLARIYFDADLCGIDSGFCSFWIYEESNGIDGLQRGDEVVDDTCSGQIEADTIIL